MLRAIPQVRSHPAIAPFLQWLDEVRENSLEYLVEMNVLEYSRAICLTALRQIEEIRAEQDTLLRHYAGLDEEARRDLALAALLHDMDKPDQDHGRKFAPRVGACLAEMGLKISPASVERIAWLVEHHLDMSGLLNRIGNEGESALEDFVAASSPERVRELILFAYADRVAVNPDPNVASHNAMVLTGLIRSVNRIERGESLTGVE
jgi:UTP:GlnB (protein PII) uridylyltransferase